MSIRHCSFVALATLAIGCGGDTAKSKSSAKVASSGPTSLTAEELAKHNRAVAHLARNEVVDAEKLLTELAETHPDSEPIVIDRAIAAMHRVRGGAQGVSLFEDALKRFPNSDRARYGLAYLYSINGKIKEAAELLEPLAAKIETDELKDPHVAYLYGRVLENLSDPGGQWLRWFKKALELDPYFYTAAYRVWQNSMKNADAKDLQQISQRLDVHPFALIIDEKIRRMGPLLDVVPYENRLASANPTPPPQGDLFRESVPLLTKSEWGTAKPTDRSSLTVCDIDGDGLLDLFFADANVAVGGRAIPNAILLQTGDRKFRLATDHPMAVIDGVTAVFWGDLNNDGFTDAVLCRRDGNQQWRQTAKAKWERFDDPKSAVGPKGLCNGGALYDADFDGDLDVVLVYEDRPNELLQNDGYGKFTAMGKESNIAGDGKGAREAIVTHRNGKRTPEIVVIGNDNSIQVFSLDLNGRFVSTPVAEHVRSGSPVMRTAIALPGNAQSKEVSTYLVPTVTRPPWKNARLELADIDGSGSLATIDSIDGQIRASQANDRSKEYELPKLPNSLAWAMANMDAKRGPSLVCLPTDGSPPVAAHPGPGRHDYFSLSFIGDRDGGKKKFMSNRSGIGVKVSMRIGDTWACQYPLSQCSGPGQSLQPMAIGSRGAGNADFLFIDWSNGDFQSEFSPPLGKTIAIKELDRMPTDSCPLLFVWNGSKYEFITDFLGVGGIDYLIRPGEYYTPTDPVENLLLPEGVVAADESKIKMKVLEAAEEITFLDRAALVAYDLPPGWRMTLDERHSALPPKVSHEPRYYQSLESPVRVMNESVVDCTEAVRNADMKSAPSPRADEKFTGRFEKPHQLTIEFAKPIAETCKNPTLLIDGWVAFPDAQAAVNASQSGVDFSAPRLEAKAGDGTWRVVYPEFGYPAGMQRQSSLPLQGLPKGCRTLRITHELEAYWDRIALIDVQACPEARRIALKLETSKLAAVGSPRYDRDREGKPFWFDYDDRNPFWPARAPTGKYTRFGDCKELVSTGDDASATIGPGEEVHLEFAAPSAPPKDWTRRYVLESRGWCRGMRIYTRNGSTVEPMPKTNLPTEQRDRLHRAFNTRVVGE